MFPQKPLQIALFVVTVEVLSARFLESSGELLPIRLGLLEVRHDGQVQGSLFRPQEIAAIEEEWLGITPRRNPLLWMHAAQAMFHRQVKAVVGRVRKTRVIRGELQSPSRPKQRLLATGGIDQELDPKRHEQREFFRSREGSAGSSRSVLPRELPAWT